MASILTPEAYLALDLELPPEAWEYLNRWRPDLEAVADEEGFTPEDVQEQLDDMAAMFRLIFWTGYTRGRKDTTATLEREVVACESTP